MRRMDAERIEARWLAHRFLSAARGARRSYSTLWFRQPSASRRLEEGHGTRAHHVAGSGLRRVAGDRGDTATVDSDRRQGQAGARTVGESQLAGAAVRHRARTHDLADADRG